MKEQGWDRNWRDRVWSSLNRQWDLIIIGGGITGAGILLEAARRGLHALLVDQGDFASGTSSRSSKLVHGGFRYLQNAQVRLTYESVRERERLLNEARGLVNPLGFLMPFYFGDRLPSWVFGLGLAAYDLLAFHWGHRYYDRYDLHELCPTLCEERLRGGYRYFDAQTDDSRLVIRILQEAELNGGTTLSYASATGLLRSRIGQVQGVQLQDQSPEGGGRTQEIAARLVINATGAWADDFISLAVGPASHRKRLRKLRGSHLIFPARRLPLSRAICGQHPFDGRFVFAVPWNGVTLVGTTDVDHQKPLETDLPIDAAEVEYLLTFAQKTFPDQELCLDDVQATFSGVRPVVDTGKKDPSKESREHVLWYEDGLLTITGGKLTTFRRMACDVLSTARRLGAITGQERALNDDCQIISPVPADALNGYRLNGPARSRLLGRYGVLAEALVTAARPGELEAISESGVLWGELRWAARAEGVVHLDDLLLRRVRLGLLLPRGGYEYIDTIRAMVQPELGWDDIRWEMEIARYTKLWKQCYHFEGST